MKYPCEIIKDLMPLYVENLCSDETKTAVEQHISDCKECLRHYKSLTEDENVASFSNDNSEIFAESLQNVKKRIKIKHIIGIMATLVIALSFAVLSSVAVIGLQHIDYPILYENNITIDTNLPEGWENYGNKYAVHCKGSVIEGVLCKEIKMETGEKYLFFQLTTNKWYDLITGKNHISHQPFSDVDYYDKIYYYPGYIMEDLAGIAEGEMEHIYSVSTLIVDNTGTEK